MESGGPEMGAAGVRKRSGVGTVFVGTFEHALDDKGRLVLPSTFRARLAGGGILSPYQGCLALWTEPEFRGFVDRLGDKVRDRAANPDALRALLANAADVRPDAQGRIAIAPRLRQTYDIAGAVVLNGAGDHVELWKPESWETVLGAGTQDLADAIATLGIF